MERLKERPDMGRKGKGDKEWETRQVLVDSLLQQHRVALAPYSSCGAIVTYGIPDEQAVMKGIMGKYARTSRILELSGK